MYSLKGADWCSIHEYCSTYYSTFKSGPQAVRRPGTYYADLAVA